MKRIFKKLTVTMRTDRQSRNRQSTLEFQKKGLQIILKNPQATYQEKIDALLSAWELVRNFVMITSQESTSCLIEWVHWHTLNIVLQGEWSKMLPATKTHMKFILQKCAELLSNHKAAPKLQELLKVVDDPWGYPILDKIISGQRGISDDEVLDICHSEMGVGLTLRLKKLCESKCECIALRLAEVAMRCLNLKGSRLHAENSEDQISYITDVYISLLYKYRKIDDITTYLKTLALEDGLMLIRRFSGKDKEHYRIWRCSDEVAMLVAWLLLPAAMLKPAGETGALLRDLLNEWALLHSHLPSLPMDLPDNIRRLIGLAESAVPIYTFCEVLEQFGEDLKTVCIELYIRGLTTDMNEWEYHKTKHDRENVKKVAVRLSNGFLKVADLLKANVGVCRECVLTAFSLNPTQSCFEKVKAMAAASGKCHKIPGRAVFIIDQDGIEKKHVSGEKVGEQYESIGYMCSENEKPTDIESGCSHSQLINGIDKSGRSLDALISIKGNTLTESLNYNVLDAPNQILDADTTGLSSQLCNDLTVLLNSPRYHMLSWVLDWTDLYKQCENYLKNCEEMRNTTKELKFLNINYNQFRDWPAADYGTGIEKGYEHCDERTDARLGRPVHRKRRTNFSRKKCYSIARVSSRTALNTIKKIVPLPVQHTLDGVQVPSSLSTTSSNNLGFQVAVNNHHMFQEDGKKVYHGSCTQNNIRSLQTENKVIQTPNEALSISTTAQSQDQYAYWLHSIDEFLESYGILSSTRPGQSTSPEDTTETSLQLPCCPWPVKHTEAFPCTVNKSFLNDDLAPRVNIVEQGLEFNCVASSYSNNQ